MRRLCALAVAAAAVILTPAEPSQARQARDVAVCRDAVAVSGDALACGGTRIRLWGVVAPAQGEPGFDEARDALAAMTRFRDVRCRIERRISQRLDEGVCRVNGRDLAARMVRAGQARATSERYAVGSDANGRSR